jgi:hypothetical protein
MLSLSFTQSDRARPSIKGVAQQGMGLDRSFLVCSIQAMQDLGYKIVRTNGGDELLARIGNYEICKAAFEKAIVRVAEHGEPCATASMDFSA